MAYRVKAPLVIVRDESGAQQYFYAGAVLPDGLDKEHVKQLADEKLLVQADESDKGEEKSSRGKR